MIKLGEIMKTNSKNELYDALSKKKAVPHFNINNLEWTKWILEVCQEMQEPVVLGVSEGASRYMGGFETISCMVNGLINDLKITIPVCLHVDHATSFETCKEAIDHGFTSVMIDGSRHNLEDNIALTKQVVAYAHPRGVWVEGEVGAIGGSEDGLDNELAYAKVEDCITFVKETAVDSLAPALGSVHGLYKGEPHLDFTRMKEISERLKIPLVLHGGTGIPDDLIRKAISCGIAKINVNTEFQVAWHNAVLPFVRDNPLVYDPRKVIKSGEPAMKDAVRNKIELFRNEK